MGWLIDSLLELRDTEIKNIKDMFLNVHKAKIKAYERGVEKMIALGLLSADYYTTMSAINCADDGFTVFIKYRLITDNNALQDDTFILLSWSEFIMTRESFETELKILAQGTQQLQQHKNDILNK